MQSLTKSSQRHWEKSGDGTQILAGADAGEAPTLALSVRHPCLCVKGRESSPIQRAAPHGEFVPETSFSHSRFEIRRNGLPEESKCFRTIRAWPPGQANLSVPSRLAKEARQVPMDARVTRIIEIMKTSPNEQLSVVTLAKRVNLSAARLHQLFQKEMQQTPMRYLRELRMQKAEHLLRTTFLSIKQVAYHCEITDVSHFVRDFKRRHGVTPTEFRFGRASPQRVVKERKGAYQKNPQKP